MPVQAEARDPRSIITPDAFDISRDLLGRPLAKPGERLAAILIDLVVIWLITLATKGFGMLLGVVAAIFFVRAGFKRTPVKGSVFNRAMRLSVGCLGVFIGLVTAAAWGILRISHDDVGNISVPVVNESGEVTRRVSGRDFLSLAQGGGALIGAGSADEARRAMRDMVPRLRDAGADDDKIRDAILAIVPKDKSWAADADSLVGEVLADMPAAAPVSPAISDEVAAMPTDQALDAYADLLRSPRDDQASTARLRELRLRILDSLGADTLRALQEAAATARSRAESQASEITRLEDELKRERDGGGVVAWIKEAANQLGFGFGWASIYLTIVLSWWNGQTVGKRAMKIRVLRLDGEPVNWWTAFERAGGYAAGVATGLLGFAQVYWDANRQCIHDRIVGTVVVKDGAPKVLDWQDAL